VYQQPIRSDGSPDGDPIRLTTGLSAHSISMSHDGSRLAYSVLTFRRNIWAAPISSSGVTPVSAARPVTDENQVVEGISVSSDGKWLVFDSNRGGSADIYKMPVSGGEVTQLTRDPADEFIPQWSRDGREIVFQSWKHGNRDLFVMNADGSGLTEVTSSPLHEMYADWSPAGDRLAYVGQTPAGPRTELFVVTRGSDGRWSAPKQLTKDGGIAIARWSSDGKYIAVGDGRAGVKLVSPDGTQRSLVGRATHGLAALGLAFGPDPNTLYFRATDSTGTVGFYSIPISGGRARPLLRFDDPARINPRYEFSTDGKRLFFTIAGDDSDLWVMELRKR
jgi:Tol biopolymer transport system component